MKTESDFYAWNSPLWQIHTTQRDFPNFIQPYMGSGKVGTRFSQLVASTGSQEPHLVLTNFVYDGGCQLPVPSWNHLVFEVEGVSFEPFQGTHEAENILDLRTGLATLHDVWEYAPGKRISISIEMLTPRSHPHSGVLRFRAEGVPAGSHLRWGIRGDVVARHFDTSLKRVQTGVVTPSPCFRFAFEKSPGRILGRYEPIHEKFETIQDLRWSHSGLREETVLIEEENGLIEAISDSPTIELHVYCGTSSSKEASEPQHELEEELHRLALLSPTQVQQENEAIWKEIWKEGLAFGTNNERTAQMFLAHQFYLLASLSEDDHPLATMGLSYHAWKGQQLWDADLWVFRAIVILWPRFAKSILRFRRRLLPYARDYAAEHGFDGAWFVGFSEMGVPICHAAYIPELHLFVWMAFAAWEFHLRTRDQDFLETTGWPLIEGIARFFASRGQFEADGLFHIREIIGPDEAVCEFGAGTCDDNFLTNFAVKRLMEIATQGAAEVGQNADPLWRKIADGIFLQTPRADGVIPEFTGYQDQGIKQADVILAIYPLGYQASDEVIRKNLEFYKEKYMAYAPCMGLQIEACLYMLLGDKERGLRHLLAETGAYMRGPHYIVFEGRHNTLNVMLTALGGELQALIFGWYGATIGPTSLVPRIGDGWTGKDL